MFAVARALFNLNSHYGTAFFFSGQKDVHLIREFYSFSVKRLISPEMYGTLQGKIRTVHIPQYIF
jgi:hypothetical protein